MNDQMNKKIKEVFEGFELPYDATAWNQLNGKMNRTTLLKKGIIAASALIILIIGGIYLLKLNSTNILLKPTQDLTSSKNSTTKNNSTSKFNSFNLSKKEKNTSVSNQLIIEKKTNNLNEIKSEVSIQTELLPSLIGNPISIITQLENNSSNSIPTIQKASTEPNLMMPSKVCLGDEIHFNYLSDNDFWIVDPIGAKDIFNSTFKPQMEGKFLVVSGDKTLGSFTVLPTPKIELNILDEDQFENGLPIAKFSASGNAQSFQWVINHKKSIGTECQVHLFLKGRYPIQLSAQNSAGCVTEITKEITIEADYNLLAATAFDVQSRDKRNNSFIPFALTQRMVDFAMIIIDPNDGGILFETYEATDPWTGIDRRTGQLVETNKPYIWKVVLKNPAFGEKSDYKGVITRL
ncbi:MAG: hypothetical protein KA521_06315 [Crocinitomicaceae bacterium]|nr:hypothetical protein [Crocinitomicaceae bacterium]